MLVDLPGTKLYVYRESARPTRAPGPSLLVLHGGLGFDHSYFLPVSDQTGLNALLERPSTPFSELIYVDLRGHGRSDPVEDWSQVDFDTFTADVEALRRELGLEKMVLLGHSYGGYLAQAFALRYPRSLAGLVLCSTAPVFDYAETALQIAGTRATPEQRAALMEGFSGPVESDDLFSDLVRTVLPIYFERGADALSGAVWQRMRMRAAAFNRGQFELLPAFDVTDQLPGVAVPTLCVGGAADWIAPPAQGPERLAALLPNAQGSILDECGHFPFLERPSEFAEVLTTWSQVALPPESQRAVI